MKLSLQRSAERHSAVSPNGIRHTVAPLQAQKLATTAPSSSDAKAFTLIETLVYMSLLFVVITLGYAAMYKSMDASTGLRRNAADITHALDAGERWREDVRTATQPLRVEKINDQETLLHIPHKGAEVTYRFESHNVFRRQGPSEWALALASVDNSTFISDPRQNVTAWKWEVELHPYRKSLSRLHPLFTFLAVPTNTPTK